MTDRGMGGNAEGWSPEVQAFATAITRNIVDEAENGPPQPGIRPMGCRCKELMHNWAMNWAVARKRFLRQVRATHGHPFEHEAPETDVGLSA